MFLMMTTLGEAQALFHFLYMQDSNKSISFNIAQGFYLALDL